MKVVVGVASFSMSVLSRDEGGGGSGVFLPVCVKCAGW